MAAHVLAGVALMALVNTVAAGLRVTGVEVPRYLIVGQSATLRCHVALEGEVLYSLKWWKDGSQFYQYIPRNKPPAVVFTVPGITINPQKSGLDEVELMDVQGSSSGQYKCEVVADAPTFTTHVMMANMTIVDTPDDKPVITGLKSAYREGEAVSLNCSSLRSNPPATLAWLNNNDQIAEEHLVRYPGSQEADLYTSTLGLSLTASSTLFPDGVLNLRCSATVHVYEWSTDVSLHLDNVTYSQPHHLPTLQQTDGAACTSAGLVLVTSLVWVLLATSPS